jgi:hypothetical protein
MATIVCDNCGAPVTLKRPGAIAPRPCCDKPIRVRLERITAMEAGGLIVPGCPSCQAFYEADDPAEVFASYHRTLHANRGDY